MSYLFLLMLSVSYCLAAGIGEIDDVALPHSQSYVPQSYKETLGTDITFYFPGNQETVSLKMADLLQGFQSAYQILDHNTAYLHPLIYPVYERKILGALENLHKPKSGLELFLQMLLNPEEIASKLSAPEWIGIEEEITRHVYSDESECEDVFFEKGFLLHYLIKDNKQYRPSYKSFKIRKWIRKQDDFLAWWQLANQILLHENPNNSPLFSQVNSLTIKYASLKEFKAFWLTNLHMDKLSRLDLSKNGLDSVDLRGLRNLKSLNLSHII